MDGPVEINRAADLQPSHVASLHDQAVVRLGQLMEDTSEMNPADAWTAIFGILTTQRVLQPESVTPWYDDALQYTRTLARDFSVVRKISTQGNIGPL